MSATCLDLLNYAEAHRVFKRADEKELEAWNKANPRLMKLVLWNECVYIGAVKEDDPLPKEITG